MNNNVIYVAIFLVAIVLVAFFVYQAKQYEGMADMALSNEAIQNLASIYNKDNLVINKLSATGDASVGGKLKTMGTWPNAVVGDGESVVVSGTLNGEAVIGGHNKNLTEWTPLRINGGDKPVIIDGPINGGGKPIIIDGPVTIKGPLTITGSDGTSTTLSREMQSWGSPALQISGDLKMIGGIDANGSVTGKSGLVSDSAVVIIGKDGTSTRLSRESFGWGNGLKIDGSVGVTGLIDASGTVAGSDMYVQGGQAGICIKNPSGQFRCVKAHPNDQAYLQITRLNSTDIERNIN